MFPHPVVSGTPSLLHTAGRTVNRIHNGTVTERMAILEDLYWAMLSFKRSYGRPMSNSLGERWSRRRHRLEELLSDQLVE